MAVLLRVVLGPAAGDLPGVPPPADGFVGGAAGVTPDGRAVVVGRYRDADAAAAHDGWWSAATAAAEPALFVATTDVSAVDGVGGGSVEEARFLQVMVATPADRPAFEQVEAEIGPAFLAQRPDFVAGWRAWAPDGTLVAVDHFTSEAEARAGEARALTDELAAGMGRWMAAVGEADWYDVPDPLTLR